MLSINPITSVDHAQSYFMGGENYYMGDTNGRSIWWGKGTEALGLAGEVQKNSFVDLLHGKLPNGELLGKSVDGKIQHRPGFDLTFSIPKSASIVALRAKEPEAYESIVSSTIKAVEKTLEIIEYSCASARVTQNGKTNFINTKNLVAALHLHELSREDEAGIHVHAVVMNMTQRPDAKWRSLASKSGYYGKNATSEINGFFERIGNQKKQLGAIFRAELAYELKQKGFPIVITDKKQGFFEIEGISTPLLEAHSSRSLQKEAYMEERGFEGGNAAAVATQVTRKTKSKRTPDTIKQEWLEKENLKGVNAELEVSDVLNKIKGGNVQNNLLSDTKTLIQARTAVEYALEVLSESQIKIKSIQLINFTLSNSIGKHLNVTTVVEAIETLKLEGTLVPIEKANGDMYYTTKTLLDYEKNIINATSSIIPNGIRSSAKQLNNAILKNELLTPNQHKAINQIFESEHQVTALEGKSYTGKTMLIKPLVEIAKSNGFAPVVLTPSQAGSNNIKNDIQKSPNKVKQFFNALFDSNEYSSVSGFVYAKTKQIETDMQSAKPMMIFVDNAQALSLKQMNELVLITEKLKAKLVPIFDTRATFSYQSGNPVQQMFEHGMRTVVLEEVIEGSSHRTISSAVQDSLENNIAGAFKKIENRLFSIEDNEQRNLTMASLFARMTFDERQKTEVIMLSKSQCEELNLVIHAELKREQHISAEGKIFTSLVPKSLKSAEYKLAQHYDAGQWVRFNESYDSINVNRGEYLKILKVNIKSNIVILEKSDKNQLLWNPLKLAGSSAKVEIFDEKLREICPGETLIWKRNNRDKSIVSSERLKVLSLSTNKMILERENNKKISIDISKNENRHFDYGYAITPNIALNKKSESIIAYQNAFSRQSHQRQFYKILSQAKNEVWIFTENKDELFKNIQRNKGNKSTVIDVILRNERDHLTATSQPHYINALEKVVEQVISRLSKQDRTADKSPQSISKEAVEYALLHLTEREAAFQHKEVMDVALKHVLGDANSDHIRDAVIQAEKDGVLIRGVYSRDGTRWTTQDAINIEREIIALAKADQGTLPALIQQEKVSAFLAAHPSLKKDHVTAITEWMKTTDRVVMVQGDAGTGKTTMLERAEPLLKSANLLNEEGYSLLCLAPTHVVVDEIRSRGLVAQTLDSFLAEQSLARTSGTAKNYDGKLIIAVDENSMVSNRRERDFLQVIKEIGARAALIGDQRQYSSIESGKPHTLLQSKSVQLKVINLNEIVRQKNPQLMKPVEHTYYKEFDKAFDLLKNNIIEIGKTDVNEPKVKVKALQGLDNASLRLEKMAHDYLALSQQQRSTTGILTLSNSHRIQLNNLIREGLKREGELVGLPESIPVLVSMDMTKIERTKTTNFEPGDVIRFGMSDPQLPVTKGEYLRIAEIHPKENLVTFYNANKEKVIWRPHSFDKESFPGIEVYRQEKREIMAGDLIRWTRSNKTLGLLSPKIVRVEAIEKGFASLCPVKMTETALISEGKSFQVDLNNPNYQHWDHAHVMTSYGAQSKGFKNVMANMDSYSRNLTNQAAFLIVLTRSIESFTLYTDNKKALLEKIQMTPGTKTSALEVTGELNLEEIRTRKANDHLRLKEASLAVSQQNPSPYYNKKTAILDANRIIPELHERAESIVIQVLGEPKSRSGSNYLYSYSEQFGGEDGKREGGSLSISIKGDKQGLWKCFKTGESGNLIGLLQKKYNMNFKESLEFAAKLLGLSSEQITAQTPSPQTKKEVIYIDKSDAKNWSKNEKYMVKIASQLAQESLPIKGTLAEIYLREHRAIDLKDIPSSLRFHSAVSGGKGLPTYPALLAVGRNDKGQVQRIQAIYLDAETGGKADLNVKKRSYALAPGSSVNLSRNVRNKQVSYLAEGVETGLSILNSIDNGNVEVVLGVSNFKHPSLKNLSKDVVFCLDNDGKNIASEKAIHEAAQALSQKGKTIWIAMPAEVGRDFNDLLKSQGASAVRRAIDQSILYSDWVSKDLNPTTMLKTELENRKLHQLPQMDDKKLAKTLNRAGISKALSMKLLNAKESKPMIDNHINDVADQLNRAPNNINKDHLNIFKSLNPASPVKEIERPKELIKDIDREI